MSVVGQVAFCVAAVALSGWLYRAGTGLRPAAIATWLAPVPVLVLAPRVPWYAAVAVAAAAWLIGQLGLWSYFVRDVRVPWPVAAAQLVMTGGGVASVVALARAHLVDGRLTLAALALPAGCVALEFLASLRSPHGAWWSLGYTQADRPLVTQVAAATGVWGITALLVLPAGVVGAVAAPAGTAGERVALLVGTAAVVAVLVVHGYRRSRPQLPDEVMDVGLAVVEQPELPVPAGSPEGSALISAYAERVRSLADQGARVVVLPEAVVAVEERLLTEDLRPLSRAAVESGVDVVVVGVIRRGETVSANVAVAIDAAGEWSEYQKQHLVPGLESAYRPGHDLLLLPGDPRLGVIICKDLDFPALVLAYRRGGARLLLAPAWDFCRDSWLHSRMAVLRGVESGVAVVRAARGGALTVSDAFGRVLAEADARRGAVLRAGGPLVTISTIYSRYGDWFGWCCVAGTAALAGILVL
jgi:apolipoprotein N-acyltransferase